MNYNRKRILIVSALTLSIVIVSLISFIILQKTNNQTETSQNNPENRAVNISNPVTEVDFIEKYMSNYPEFNDVYIKSHKTEYESGSYKLVSISMADRVSGLETDSMIILLMGTVIAGLGEDPSDDDMKSIGIPDDVISKYKVSFSDGYDLQE